MLEHLDLRERPYQSISEVASGRTTLWGGAAGPVEKIAAEMRTAVVKVTEAIAVLKQACHELDEAGVKWSEVAARVSDADFTRLPGPTRRGERLVSDGDWPDWPVLRPAQRLPPPVTHGRGVRTQGRAAELAMDESAAKRTLRVSLMMKLARSELAQQDEYDLLDVFHQRALGDLLEQADQMRQAND